MRECVGNVCGSDALLQRNHVATSMSYDLN